MDARRIVKAADSQPEFVLRAVQLVLAGTSPEHLPRNLPEKVYDDLVKRVLPEGLDERKRVSNALVAIALVGVVNLGDPKQRSAFQSAGIETAALGKLVERRTIVRNEEAFSLSLDTFRAHVVRRAMDHRRLDVLSGTPRELAELAGPLLEEWFDGIWRICALSSKDSPFVGEVRAELLAAFDAIPRSGWSHAKALDVAMKLSNSNWFEPDPEQRIAIADRVRGLREKYDTTEMALVEATALNSAAVGGGDIKGDPDLIEKAGDMQRGMHAGVNSLPVLEDGSGNSFVLLEDALRVVDGFGSSLKEYEARLRAVTAVSPEHCVSMAERIGEVRKKYNTPEIAEQEANTLASAAFYAGTADWCVDMADRIEAIRAEHPTADIAEHETNTLRRAIEIETDSVRKEALEKRLAQLNRR